MRGNHGNINLPRSGRRFNFVVVQLSPPRHRATCATCATPRLFPASARVYQMINVPSYALVHPNVRAAGHSTPSLPQTPSSLQILLGQISVISLSVRLITNDLSFSEVTTIPGNTLFTTICRHGIDAQIIAAWHSTVIAMAL